MDTDILYEYSTSNARGRVMWWNLNVSFIFSSYEYVSDLLPVATKLSEK